jgi:MFS family permease
MGRIAAMNNVQFNFFVAGANFGTMISMPLSGYLCSLEFLGGWPLSFYIFGGLGVVWFVAWLFLVYDMPSSHPYISLQEKNYIISQVGDNRLVSTVQRKTVFALNSHCFIRV